MKISELIHELQGIVEDYGDVSVYRDTLKNGDLNFHEIKHIAIMKSFEKNEYSVFLR